MKPELKQKVNSYLTTKFNAEQQKLYEYARLKAAALPRFGIGNAAYSEFSDGRHVRIQAECVRALVLKRAEIHLEAYELYDVSPDDAIVADAQMLLETIVASRSNSVAGQLSLEVMRNVRGSEQSKAIGRSFKQQLTIQTQYTINEVICLVEKARVMHSKKQEVPSSIMVQGANARININSVDISQNEVKSN
jgi:hypothetical protein